MTLWRYLQLMGLICLAVVLFAHVAERFHIFPSMGWGLPHSPGHYLDLVGAIVGCLLLPAGLIGQAAARRKNSH